MSLTLFGVGLMGLTACVEPKLVSEIEPSMSMRGAASFYPDDHLVEIVIHEGYIYAANSWRGLGAIRLEDDGSLTVTEAGDPLATGDIRCTTLALHPSSDTLYCSADQPAMNADHSRIERFDLSEPGHPVRLASFELEHWAVRDLEVFGDTLLIHHFDDGLWTARIGPDKELTDLQQSEAQGNARISAVMGDRVITAFSAPEGRGTELRALGGRKLSELARLELDGPPLGLSADPGGGRLAVGLGSGGMAIVEVGPETLELSRTLHPPAVVTHALIEDDLAVAITFSGAFVYRLSSPPADPREAGEVELIGFAPEGAPGHERDGNMLHALLHEGDLITSDWTWIERWDIVPDGQIVALDLPRGLHVAPGGPVAWQMRSVSPIPLRAELWVSNTHLLDVEIPGPGLTTVELPAKARAKLLVGVPRTQINVRVHDPTVDRAGQPLSTSAIVISQREEDALLPPAIGDSFPPLHVVDRNQQPYSLPLSEGTQTVMLVHDCTLQFPQLEDLAWHARNDRDLGRGTPVILSDTELYQSNFAPRWSLESLRVGYWGVAAPPELAEANAVFGERLRDALRPHLLPSGAQGADYVIDQDGEVVSVTRMYRGEWALTPTL